MTVQHLLALLLAGVLTIVQPVYCDRHSSHGIHFVLARRNGPFAPNRTADLDLLSAQLAAAEARFNLTQREVRGNKVVRAPKSKAVGGGETSTLIGETGRAGNWFATFRLGEQKQPIETDLDMLTADFAITSTSSHSGTKFQDQNSSTYVWSNEHPFPNCNLPKDNLMLPSIHQQFPLTFPHCRPARQSPETLHASGGILGLAPAESLRQISSSAFIRQLLDSKIIEEDVFSITLINGHEGLLSIGGTAAESMTLIQDRIEQFLGKSAPTSAAEKVLDTDQDAVDLANGAPRELIDGTRPIPRDLKGQPNARNSKGGRSLIRRGLESLPAQLTKRARKPKPLEQKATPGWRDQWKWSPVEGAEGWWQTLMRGVWSDGVKILKNQPCVVDINMPFVLAPPQAAKQFYSSISGSQRLPPPYSNFYAFPCNNPPLIHLEFGGWRFPAMRGMKSYESSNGPNGKFSLGKVTDESGYCVGAVVETRMGVGDQSPVKKGHSRKEDNLHGLGSFESGMLAGNGMRDVWVLGEPMFRGLGVVFDAKAKSIGFRTY